MRSIELFAGAGGLALGASLAGFAPDAVIEWDKWACDTIRENQQRHNPLVLNWPVHEQDVRTFDFSLINKEPDLLAGGPPCQPFSLGGKHKAYSDRRDMFPATIETVRKLKPKAFLIENVKGLTRASFNNYFQYTLLQLTYPELTRHQGESWHEHLARLEEEKTSGLMTGLTYDIVYRVLNAADFGVPQRRERVFIVGFRHDLNVRWSFPESTHSADGLLHSQWITGDYWDRHKVSRKERNVLATKTNKRTDKIRDMNPETLGKPWLTVRDALQGLPDPEDTKFTIQHGNHIYQPGARVYPGHTGSPLDLPAKTLKAGDHGVPGGENMLVMPNGKVRYFTVRESARLQTFPDSYAFHGSWTETMRQLGNAVPVALARIISGSIAEKLIESETNKIMNKILRDS